MTGSEGSTDSSSRSSSKKPKYSRFSQQELPAFKPILTPGWIIAVFVLIGIIFIPVGLVSLSAANQVEEISERYDDKCGPSEDKNKAVEFIQSDKTNKTCVRTFTVKKKMKNPIYVYYQLDKYFQNHRRYVKSRNDLQLSDTSKANEQTGCDPILNSSNPIIPCGLIAWSLFNDTYKFSLKDKALEIDKKDIAWKSDKDYKFGSQVYPKNFQSGGSLGIGGGKLKDSVPLSEQDDLIVWMRTAALPTFRKLYGKIAVDLEVNDVVTVTIENNYNTYKYDGEKVLVLSTTTWLGGKNSFIGRAYIILGGISLFVAAFFTLLYLMKPRPIGDPAYLSWNKYPAGEK
ncbi:ALA-interacting subunit [Heracleum sosnowskyi]|uniref:ALA-interacting subunit n=1 Tax=Heracleum sosnowskyi TaxID=360622 RepID=A0AAD8IY37_9APIA|nr:ALA-interacting subunit [Heracleum sosnowskyi]